MKPVGANKGHTGLIMDNLLAEGEARPFISVMGNSYVPDANYERGPGATNEPPAAAGPCSRAFMGSGERTCNPARLRRSSLRIGAYGISATTNPSLTN